MFFTEPVGTFMVRTDIGASLADRLENRWGHDVDSDDLDQVLDKLGAGILNQSLQQEALTSLANYCSAAFATYSTVCHETRLNSCFYSSYPDGRIKSRATKSDAGNTG